MIKKQWWAFIIIPFNPKNYSNSTSHSIPVYQITLYHITIPFNFSHAGRKKFTQLSKMFYAIPWWQAKPYPRRRLWFVDMWFDFGLESQQKFLIKGTDPKMNSYMVWVNPIKISHHLIFLNKILYLNYTNNNSYILMRFSY